MTNDTLTENTILKAIELYGKDDYLEEITAENTILKAIELYGKDDHWEEIVDMYVNFYLGRIDRLNSILTSCHFELNKEENKALLNAIREEIKRDKRIIDIMKESVFTAKVEKLRSKGE